MNENNDTIEDLKSASSLINFLINCNFIETENTDGKYLYTIKGLKDYYVIILENKLAIVSLKKFEIIPVGIIFHYLLEDVKKEIVFYLNIFR